MKYIKEASVRYTRKRVDDDLLNCDARAPYQVYELFKHMQDETREKVICIHLGVDGSILCYEVVSMGTPSSALIDVREIFRGAVLTGASEITIVHNHPLVSSAPSYDDIKVYQLLRDAGNALKIPVRDFMIIGENDYYSFDEEAIL